MTEKISNKGGNPLHAMLNIGKAAGVNPNFEKILKSVLNSKNPFQTILKMLSEMVAKMGGGKGNMANAILAGILDAMNMGAHGRGGKIPKQLASREPAMRA